MSEVLNAAQAAAPSHAPSPSASPFDVARPKPKRATIIVATTAAVLHVLGIWLIQRDLHPTTIAMEPPEIVLVQIAAPSAAPPKPKTPPEKPPAPKTPVKAQHIVQQVAQAVPVAPAPVFAEKPSPPSPQAPPTLAAARAEAPVIQEPTTDADYADACRVIYPPMSRRMHEHGRVILKVLVGRDGRAKRLDVMRSSGHRRLDDAAGEAMRRCRFRPGTVDGDPRDMAYEAPVDFVLR